MSQNVENQVQSQKHKYEVTNLHDLHYHSIRLHISRDVSSHVEVVQTMVDQMKTALEEAQANLSYRSQSVMTYLVV